MAADLAPPRPVEIPQRLPTRRLELRAPHPDDAPAMVDAIAESFAELHRWMPWASDVPSVEQEREILASRAAQHASGAEPAFSMWDRASGHLVGGCGLPRPRWRENAFEIGYWVRTSRVGLGYATEATLELAKLAFAALAARRVELRISARNARSAAVARRAGFRLERTNVADGFDPDGSVRDTLVFAAYGRSEIASVPTPAVERAR